ncbi:MAG TPA: penicillin-binding protein 2 [Sedimentisphaerales bacterium]|nr:penicillin-binding protein 2 [Sedimentisphaerales bacterium]
MKSNRITLAWGIVLMAIFAGLLVRCCFVQIINAEKYRSNATRQQQAFVRQSGSRGVILDRRGRVLAASNRIDIVYVDPQILRDTRAAAVKLAPILVLPIDEIEWRMKTGLSARFRRIGVINDPWQAQEIAKLRIPGVGIQSGWQRHYTTGALASHVTGFTDIDGNGLAGVELRYDEYLQGQAQEEIFLADVFRRPIRLKERRSEAMDGKNLILTIDATIQKFARQELVEQCVKFEAEAGIAIVMDPHTGAVLAMVSWPDFDTNSANRAPVDAKRNRALTDPYEPGSIFKPLVVAAAMDRGVITPQTVIYCESGHYQGRGFGSIREYNNRAFGNLTPKEILVRSSNIGMAKIGQLMGPQKLYDKLSSLGIGQRTGIDLPGEGTGVLWPVGRWTGFSVTRIPFGQEVSVTALQMIRAFCILANGGRPVTPYVVQGWVEEDADGRPRVTNARLPELPAGFVIRPEVARWVVQEALVASVNEGTGRRAALKNWQVFGKTGTANIADTQRRGFTETYVSSFIGGAPAEDPRVVVLVSVRNPNRRLGRGFTGGVVAAPVVGRILERTLTYLDTH